MERRIAVWEDRAHGAAGAARGMTDDERARIYEGNARRVLGVPA
jgi:hypothetical protein